MNQIQHGDVLLHRIEAFPDGLKLVKPHNGRAIVAEGEATGHAHAMDCVNAILLEGEDGTFYLDVKKETDITHEEHKAITVPPGMYEIGRVVEVDPLEGEVRQVAD